MAENEIIYISGPVTNCPGYKTAFRRAAEALKEKGHVNVINPAELDSVMHGEATYKHYMVVCLQLLELATHVVLLPGWEKSTGCNRELGYAIAKGLKVTEYEED